MRGILTWLEQKLNGQISKEKTQHNCQEAGCYLPRKERGKESSIIVNYPRKPRYECDCPDCMEPGLR